MLSFHFIVENTAQRSPHTGYLQAMGKPVVHKYAAGQRKNLCFVLKSAERGRKDQPVVVTLKFGTRIMLVTMYTGFITPSFGGKQLLPIHCLHNFAKVAHSPKAPSRQRKH